MLEWRDIPLGELGTVNPQLLQEKWLVRLTRHTHTHTHAYTHTHTHSHTQVMCDKKQYGQKKSKQEVDSWQTSLLGQKHWPM